MILGGWVFLMSEAPLYSRARNGQSPLWARVLDALCFTQNKCVYSGVKSTWPPLIHFYILEALRAPNIGGHRNLFCRKTMLPFGSH